MKTLSIFLSIVFLNFLILFSYQSTYANSNILPDDMEKKLDSLITSIVQNNNLPSVVVGVFIPNEKDYLITKGMANLETNLPREFNDQYRIASITKTFIATAVLQLTDSGKLSTSDKLSKWYPDFPNSDIVTIKDLLMMRSGIYDSWDHERLTQYYINPLMNLTADDMIKFSAEERSKFRPPDTESVYCNLNYIFLEKILEKVTGMKTNHIMDEFIFKPLGMASSLYPVNTELPGNLHGYSFNTVTEKFDDKTLLNPEPIGGTGAIISSVNDLKTYARALYIGTLLKSETQKVRLEIKNMKDIPDFIGYGEGIMKFGGFFGHNGTICGFSSEMFYLPEKDAVIIINVSRLDLDDKSQSAIIFQETSKLFFPEYVNW